MDENSDDIVKNGVRVVTLSSWHEFHQRVLSLESKRGYVWRGQKRGEDSGWLLRSSFDRKDQSKDRRDRDERLQRHLQNFKEEMNKHFPNVLPQDELDIWVLGQHYGLKTPLLDWTLSPYVAAYFAFNECIDQNDQNDCYRYVYALDRCLKRLMIARLSWL